jgi:hypothetical protein
MPRRVSLPGAAELFRTTPAAPHLTDQHHPSAAASPASPAVAPSESLDDAASDGQGDSQVNGQVNGVNGQVNGQVNRQGRRPDDGIAEQDSLPESPRPAAERDRAAKAAPRGSGRVRHDEKITVYVSNDELLDLERARLQLRADHGMAVDRGRIVREALALAIGDLGERGADSDLVRRLSQQ